MKRWLSKVWLKVLSLLLCCCFAGLLVGAGGWSFWMMETYMMSLENIYQDDSYWVDQLVNRYGWISDAMNCYLLSLYEDDLTQWGQQDYQDLQSRLSADNTNFRCRLLDQTGKVVWDNLDGQSWQEDAVNTEEWTFAQSGYVDYQSYEDADAYESDDGTNTEVWSDDSTTATESADEVDTAAMQSDPDVYGYYLDTYIAQDAQGDPILLSEENDYLSVYTVEWFIDPSLPVSDLFAHYASQVPGVRQDLRWLLPVAAVCALLALLTGLWFLAACGHKTDVDGIYLCRLHRMPYDVLLVLDAAVVWLTATGFWLCRELLNRDASGTVETLPAVLYLSVAAGVLMLLASPSASTLVTQLKARSLWKRTVVGRVCRTLWRGLVWFVRRIGLFWKAVLAVCAFLAVYSFCWFQTFYNYYDVLFLLAAAVLALAALVGLVWWLSGWKRVMDGTQRIAGGDLNYHIDTDKLPYDLKQQADCLNDLSVGMEKAVAQQIKSDRFRTELITNVSHDLKTPLTSIISYVDLLKQLNIQDQPAADYIDVLDRKSQRLKALTEDLVEASKAATGVLAVSLERLEVVQLVQQSLGEYEERLTDADLTLCTGFLKEPTWIRADGRHLWRVLDNLLGNCVKYAMPGTRVYLDMEDTGERVVLTLKNISAQPLNISPEELTERFVRGDSSRTTEGSGLGLSIAQSLCVLQGGTFALDTDGDLFKVTLSFEKAQE